MIASNARVQPFSRQSPGGGEAGRGPGDPEAGAPASVAISMGRAAATLVVHESRNMSARSAVSVLALLSGCVMVLVTPNEVPSVVGRLKSSHAPAGRGCGKGRDRADGVHAWVPELGCCAHDCNPGEGGWHYRNAS